MRRERVRARIVGIAIISLCTALGAALLASCPALAWVRTTVHLSDGGAGPCLFWGPRGHSFMIDSRGTPDVPGSSAFIAIRAGFETWADAGCSDLVFPDLGLSTNPADRVVGYFPGQYNRNLLLFRTANCENGAVPPSDPCLESGGCGNKYDCWDHDSSVIATTTTTTNRSTGQLLDADVEFNDATAADGTKYTFTTIDSPPCDDASQSNCVNIDVQNTATHEEGHTIGLGHSLDPAATMYATAPMGETSKRHLAQDDLDAICTIYPKGAQTLTCLGGPIELTENGENDHAGCGCTQSGSAVPSLEGSLLAIALCALFRARRGRVAI
jgi:hypothetical protein